MPKQIKDYPEKINPDNTDWLVLQDPTGINRKISRSNLLKGVNANSLWKFQSSNYSALASDNVIADASSSFNILIPDFVPDGTQIRILVRDANNSGNAINFSSSDTNFNSTSKQGYIAGNGKQAIFIYFQFSGWLVFGDAVLISQFPLIPVRYRFSASLVYGLNNNDLVSSVNDLSGNNFISTTSGTARPTYKTNVLADKPAFLFNGSSNFLDLGSSQIIPDTDDFVIFKIASYAANSVCIGSGGNTGGSWGLQMGYGINYIVSSGSLVLIDFPEPNLNSFNIYALARLNGRWRAWVNGGIYADGGTNIVNIRGSDNGYQQKTIIGGKWDGAAMEFMNGYLTDVCVKISPTISDINLLGNYYANQYNLIWNTAS